MFIDTMDKFADLHARVNHPNFGHTLDVGLGTFNTAVLICSSLTMALAVREAQKGRRRSVAAFLFGTIVLGGAFLGIKAQEYRSQEKNREEALRRLREIIESVARVPTLPWLRGK